MTTIVLLFSCKNDSTSTADQKSLTPEVVAKEWVEAFYSDDFKKAKKLGTKLTRMMIDSVQKEMIPGVESIEFKITDMACVVRSDSAFCTFVYHEEGEASDDFVMLIKEGEQWLVNDSWEDE